MIDKLKHTLKHTFVYSMGNLATKLIGLILLPIYTSHLTPADYGVLSILEITSQLLTIIFSANLSTTMMRWWVDAKDQQQRKKIVFTAFTMLLISLLIMNILLQPFAGKFATIFFSDSQFKIYFTILFISSSFDILSRYMLDILRLLEKSVLYITITTIKLILVLGLTIYLFVVLKWGIKGILLAQLAGFIFMTIILIPVLVKNSIPKFETSIIKGMLKYSMPLVFTSLSSIVFSFGDRYVLKFLSGDKSVGIYTLSYKIAGMMKFVVLIAFTTGFTPIAYKVYKEENSDRFFSKVMTYLIMVLTFGSLALAMFSPEFVRIFSPKNQDYWEAAKYVGPIGIVVVLSGMRYMFSLSFNLSKKTIYVPIIVTSFALVNIILDMITIPVYGINGAIISSIISSILINITYKYIGNKLYRINYNIKKDSLIIIIGILLYILSLFIKTDKLVVSIIYKSLILMLFIAIIYFCGFLEEIEKQRINEFASKIRLKLFGQS